MCLIIFCRSSKPQKKLLEIVNKTNGDGIGIGFYNNKKQLSFKKGKDLSVDDLHELTQTLELPFVIHFRKKTEGEINDRMCHPFPIHDNVPLVTEGRAEKLFFHNGTFKEWQENLLRMALYRDDVEIPPGEWSDSRALAKMIYHSGDHFLNLINNRFLIMHEKDKLIRRYGQWWTFTVDVTQGIDSNNNNYDDGMFFSNDYWKHEDVLK